MASVERSWAGRPARLTEQVMEDILSGVRTGSPIDWCAEIVGVDAKELQAWRREADAALYKPRRTWSELESRAVRFFARLRQAEADAGMRLHMAGAQMAGLTRERPKRRRTRQRVESTEGNPVIIGDDGKVTGGRVIEVEVVEEEMAPSLNALKMIAGYRFPETMGPGVAVEDDWSTTTPERMTNDALVRALTAAGQRAGVAPGEPAAIDVASELAEDAEDAEDPADDPPDR